jgi:hypothetical protein
MGGSWQVRTGPACHAWSTRAPVWCLYDMDSRRYRSCERQKRGQREKDGQTVMKGARIIRPSCTPGPPGHPHRSRAPFLLQCKLQMIPGRARDSSTIIVGVSGWALTNVPIQFDDVDVVADFAGLNIIGSSDLLSDSVFFFQKLFDCALAQRVLSFKCTCFILNHYLFLLYS